MGSIREQQSIAEAKDKGSGVNLQAGMLWQTQTTEKKENAKATLKLLSDKKNNSRTAQYHRHQNH